MSELHVLIHKMPLLGFENKKLANLVLNLRPKINIFKQLQKLTIFSLSSHYFIEQIGNSLKLNDQESARNPWILAFRIRFIKTHTSDLESYKTAMNLTEKNKY
ncbi:MAG: hypothetical protein KBH11_10545 [Bacteroidia bacterium]|nr:hypothetical protein [Bacteroidota bacterium]MBP9083506.1 hypothetical protein [Bacteroidia bacterium]MBK7969189.1 hypothetical protein [Bacteroidota bacterium]MBK8413333.1 hypothetical protein [Bacteroidota bacterium]MBK8876643.1 hypothetical protein [Bacteroidota bacterium]